MEKLKIIIVPLLLVFIINSCRSDRHEYVDACFTITGTEHYVRETVNFVNCSKYAVSYDWSFGDTNTSTQRNPSHTYTTNGNFRVTMTAIDQYGNYDTYTKDVTILGSTDLDILVMFEGTQVTVPDCEVTLYESDEDWQNFQNPLVSGNTNNSGIIVFTGLDPVVYYIDAYLEGDNVYYSNEELDYITDELEEDEVNEYNIYVRQYASSKKNNRKELPIVKIEKTTKEEHDRIIEANLNK